MTSPSPAGGIPTSAVGAAVAAGGSLGRYFNLTSLLPAILLVLWCYVLLGLRPFTRRPDWRELGFALVPDTRAILPLVLGALVLAFFLHPLQFGLTRLLEGYWGSSGLARRVSAHRINAYRRCARELEKRADEHYWKMVGIAENQRAETLEDREDYPDFQFPVARGDALMIDYIGRQEALRRRDDFPHSEERILPTRLGNALRCMEETAGTAYGLRAITIAPHLLLLGDQEQARYVQGQGETMDLAIRLCLVGAVMTALTGVAFANDDVWWFLVLVPYGLVYVAYRGAVTAARDYAAAFVAFVDLNRFALYEALGLRRPTSLYAERQQNADLMKILGGGNGINLLYRPAGGVQPVRPSQA